MLSQTTEYALRAVVFLGESYGEPRTTREVAEATRVPGGYLSKVLQALSRAGLVRSQRGLHGGFTLRRAPQHISVYDVIQTVDPIRRIVSCPLELPEHSGQLCALHRRLDDALATIEATFRATSIAQVIAERSADQLHTLCANDKHAANCRHSCVTKSDHQPALDERMQP